VSRSKLFRVTAVDVELVVEDSYARILVGHRMDTAGLDVDRCVAVPRGAIEPSRACQAAVLSLVNLYEIGHEVIRFHLKYERPLPTPALSWRMSPLSRITCWLAVRPPRNRGAPQSHEEELTHLCRHKSVCENDDVVAFTIRAMDVRAISVDDGVRHSSSTRSGCPSLFAHNGQSETFWG
jgi:hypothetical protein